MTKHPPQADRHTIAQGADANSGPSPPIVRDLNVLVEQGAKFPTIYADPPWPYSNRAARGAAEKHYRTMTLNAIRDEPVKSLAAEKAHLHLWTTNPFLRQAFDVMQAWGFGYKSCLVWIKPQLGMGNDWRVSHECLLLGVRGDSESAGINRLGVGNERVLRRRPSQPLRPRTVRRPR